jgi:transcription elongation factor GreA
MATTSTPAVSARQAIEKRLAVLANQRLVVSADALPPAGAGDAVDRTISVESQILLFKLDQRMADLRLQLQELPATPGPTEQHDLAVGDQVTLRFGDEKTTETFLIGSIEQSRPGLDVITPTSPLGAALVGRRANDTVTYRAGLGGSITAHVVAITSADL